MFNANYIFLLSVFISFASVINCRRPDEPIISINTDVSENVTLPNDIFIKQALSFILTGDYGSDPSTSILDDDRLDNSTLDAILSGLPLILAGEADNYFDYDTPEYVTDEIINIADILDRLDKNGTSAVLFGEVRKYLVYLTPQNVAGFLWARNGEASKERLLKYVADEFLGGTSGVCKAHALSFFADLPKGETWALEMLDALAKPPAGIIQANINWMGDYKGCHDIFQQFEELPAVEGKYCRSSIGFPILDELASDLPIPPGFGLTYGLCISSACNNSEVASILSNSLKLLMVYQNAYVNNVKCDTSEPMPTTGTVYGVFLLLIVIWVVICTIFDVVVRFIEEDFSSSNKVKPLSDSDIKYQMEVKQDVAGNNIVDANTHNSKQPNTSGDKKVARTKLIKFIINSSLYTNSEKLMRTDNGGKISCLNGIRVLSMVWIIFGHSFNYLAERSEFLVADNVRSLQALVEEPIAQLILNAMYGVDTFFLMSAFLLTISFMNKMKKNGRLTPFEWAYYYIHRYWRLAPPFLIAIIINVTIIPWLGNGPLWTAEDFRTNKNEGCYTYWWAYLLFVNNFLPNDDGIPTCMGPLWYIPNDYQYYALSPIFLIILYKYPLAGKLLLSFTLTASLSVLALLTANVYIDNGKEIIQVLINMWDDVYIKPYCRASPWIVGIFLGYMFYLNQNKNIKLHKAVVLVGWIFSTVLALTCIFGGFTNHAKGGRRMSSEEYAIFFSLTRFTWPLSISWIIFACHNGYGGIINKILSAHFFIPLSRLSYCAYLVHPPLMIYYYFALRAPFRASPLTLIYIALGHLFTTIILSYFFSMFFEIPFISVEKLVYDPSSINRKRNIKPKSEEKQIQMKEKGKF